MCKRSDQQAMVSFLDKFLSQQQYLISAQRITTNQLMFSTLAWDGSSTLAEQFC